MTFIRGHRYSAADLEAIQKARAEVQARVTYIHFGLNQDQLRRKAGSSGDFCSPAPMCGHGSAHARCDSRISHVTCPVCLAMHKTKPAFL